MSSRFNDQENNSQQKVSVEENIDEVTNESINDQLELQLKSAGKHEGEPNESAIFMEYLDDENAEDVENVVSENSDFSLAELNLTNQGTVQELPNDGYSANWGVVNSVARDLGLSGNQFYISERTDIATDRGFATMNYFPIAPDIDFFPPESLLRTSNFTTLEGNLFEQGASGGLDGFGSMDINGIGQGYQKSYIAGGIVITTPEGNTLTLYTQDQPASDIRMGDYVYTLNTSMMHNPGAMEVMDIIHPETGEPIQIYIDPFTYTITDQNGDSVSGKIVAKIIDDLPAALDLTPAPIDEADISSTDSLPGGTNQSSVSAEISGSLIDFVDNYFGADGGLVTRVTIENEISNVTLNGQITVTTKEGNVLVVNQATGQYTYTLSNPIDNNDHQNATDDEALEIFEFEFTDGDGDSANAALTITVVDDEPIAADIDGGNLDEASLANGTAPNDAVLTQEGVLIDGIANQFGADGGEVTKVEIEGGTTDYSNPDYITVTTYEGNTLSVNRATGAYVYTLSHPIDNNDNPNATDDEALEIFEFEFTDGDGDTADAELTITIIDDVPVAANINAGTLNEASLSDGSLPDADALILTGTLINGAGNHFGADGGWVSNAFIQGGDTTIANNTITVWTVEGNRLEIDQTNGNYTYTLLAAVGHANGMGNNQFIDSFTFVLSDNDGDSAQANLNVTIIDDVPDANPVDAGRVDEVNLPGEADPDAGALILTGSIFDNPDNKFGADDGTITDVTIDGGTTDSSDPNVITVTTHDDNILVVNRTTGEYTYTLINPVDHDARLDNEGNIAFDRFNYEFTDNDGDVDTSTITVEIRDLIPPVANPDTIEFGAELGAINLVLALDYSGSMNGARIAALKQFIAAPGGLIDTYAGLSSEITITVILFDDSLLGGGTRTFSDPSAAKTFVSTTSGGGGTNYRLPMDEAYNALENAPSDAKNIFYFVTDGTGASVPTQDFYDDWHTLLNDNQIDSVAVSIGVPPQPSQLEPIANPDDDPKIRTTDGALTDIEDILLSDTQQITGNIMLDDNGDGADDPGNGIGLHVSAFSQVIGGVTVDGTFGTPFTTEKGATIILNADGSFTYEASLALLRDAYSETFSYTIENSSGTSTSTFTINVTGAAPVIIDMDGDGVIDVSSISEGIMYDIDGDGTNEQTSWVGPNDGMLVFDFQGDGQVTDAKEFVFTMWDETAQTDMEALRNVFDTNGDGALTSEDEGWAQFGIWQDKNGDGISDEGEYFTLDELGFERLDLFTNEEMQHLNASTSHGVSQLHHKDGYSIDAHDISIQYVDVIIEEPLFENESAPQSSPSHSSAPDLPPLANDSDFSAPSPDANLAHDLAMPPQNTESLG